MNTKTEAVVLSEKQKQVAAFKRFVAELEALYSTPEEMKRECYFEQLVVSAGTVAANILNDFPAFMGVMVPDAEHDKAMDEMNVRLQTLHDAIAALEQKNAELSEFDVRRINRELEAAKQRELDAQEQAYLAGLRAKELQALLEAK